MASLCGTSNLNRLGFTIIGLTNNLVIVIMLTSAFDLLKQQAHLSTNGPKVNAGSSIQATNKTLLQNSTVMTDVGTMVEHYCNKHSTSVIMLADYVPALATKLIYPFLLDSVSTDFKAVVAAAFSAIAFLITGLSTDQMFIFMGVACGSFSFGLGESNFLSTTPLYGDSSLAGWSMGTGAAGLFGAVAYSLLRMVLPIRHIMMIMLLAPMSLLVSYFCLITPVVDRRQVGSRQGEHSSPAGVSLSNKLRQIPRLTKYLLPLMLVFFVEYFIRQGLTELIYYPEVAFLDHAAQYRWLQVAYQIGVMLSRSSIELFRIKQIWTMSLLQLLNGLIFLAHTSKIIHLPNFYLVFALIIYEGLLGGFTYVNGFYRIKNEVPAQWREFSISVGSIADTIGIVAAGLVALPVHNALCPLYD